MVRFTKFIVAAIYLQTTLAQAVNPNEDIILDVEEPEPKEYNPLKDSPVGEFVGLFTQSMFRGLKSFFNSVQPKRLSQPRGLQHGSIQDLRDNFGRSVISICAREKELGITCVCPTFTNVKIIENKEWKSVAIIATDAKKKHIIVSYRGTATIRNFLTDADTQLVSYPGLPTGIRVHRGFLNHYYSSSKEVAAAVTDLLNKPELKDYTLHVTGYSLGAAVSLISLPGWKSLVQSRNENRKLEIYAYSSPRAGNANFVSYLASLNVPITRYTNNNDLVTHLPARASGYVHAGVEIYQDGNDLRVCSQLYDEDPTCGWSERFRLSAVRHVLPFGRVNLPPYC